MDALLVVVAAVLSFALTGLLATLLLVWRARRRAPRLGGTVTVDGVQLHYVQQGEGRPVVFLHGAKGSAYDALLSVGPLLAQRYRLLVFDRPGFGYSARAATDNGSPYVQARLLGDALRALGAERPVVVAHSAGAPVALALALERPEEVAAVVTLGGYVFAARDPARALNRLLTAPVLGSLLRWTVVVPLGHLLAPIVVRHTFAPDPSDRAYARLAPSLALRPSALAGDARDLPMVEAGLRTLARHYAGLQVPVVAVHGLADAVVSAAQAVRLCQLAPRSDLVLLEETGHQPHFARPKAVLEAVALAWRRAAQPTFAAAPSPAYTADLAALGGEPAVPCTRNPLQRG